jgi:hypothetical protein
MLIGRVCMMLTLNDERRGFIMKASELIRNIEEKIDIFGDLEVGVWEYEEWVPCEVLTSKDFYDEGTFFGEGEGFKDKFIISAVDTGWS